MTAIKRFFNFPLMRRFIQKKLQHTSIQGRITRVIFISCLLTLLLCSLFATILIITQHSLLKKNGEEIGEFASSASSDVILKQSVTQTGEYIHASVKTLDDYLRNLQDQVVTVRDYIEYMYDYPNRSQSIRVPLYSDVVPGLHSIHYYLSHGVSMDSDKRKELGFLAYTEYMTNSIRKRYPEILTFHIYTASGLGIDTDIFAQYKQRIVDNKTVLDQSPWYKLAKENGKVSITDPYRIDFNPRQTHCITIAAPFYHSNGKLLGVIGADISLGALSRIISSIPGNNVDFVMLQGEERLIAHSLVGQLELTDEFDSYFAEVKEMQNGVVQKLIPNYRGDMAKEKEAYLIWEKLTYTDWKLVGFAPVAGIVSPAEKIKQYISAFTYGFLSRANIFSNIFLVVNIFFSCLIIAVCIYFARKTSKRISKPIVILTEDAIKIGQGDLDYTIKLETGDEIETLAYTINKMVADIKHITAEKERIGAELDVAKQIQNSMLPNIFPPYPDRTEFDLFGCMRPAKEVGGDFYDFYLIDEHKLAITIADVSGKGVPAALFMVITKTLLMSVAPTGKTPSETFAIVNDLLCENNDAGMFVTTFLGVLDLQTYVFTYVNAGQNPPLLRKNNGTIERLAGKRGMVLGAISGSKYAQTEITLDRDDMLYFYTDGVTEAMNGNNDLFTENRLLDVINKHHSKDLKACVTSLISEIDAFAEGVEQADDITVLVLHVNA